MRVCCTCALHVCVARVRWGRRRAPSCADGDAGARPRERAAPTDELLISDVQGHVAERGGHGAHHAVVIYSQQLHEDGQALLLAHGGPDVH